MSSEAERTTRAAHRAHVFSVLTVLLVVLTLFLSLSMTFAVWHHDANREESNGTKIDQLEQQLDAARTELQAANVEATELVRCNGAFATLLQDTSYDHETAIGRLLVAIITYLQVPVDQRVPGPVAELTEQVRVANRAYEEAVARRAAWTADGSPLPCPI